MDITAKSPAYGDNLLSEVQTVFGSSVAKVSER
jgi:hypothetical protein